MPYISSALTESIYYDTITVNYIPFSNSNPSNPKADSLEMIFHEKGNNKCYDWELIVTDFAPELAYIPLQSALIVGLGFGVYPYWIQQNTNCKVIDVIEPNKDVISFSNTTGHLNSFVNIINSSAQDYIPTQTYDLIILDCWFGGTWDYELKKVVEIEKIDDKIVNKYNSYLEDGGYLMTPIFMTN